MCDVAHLTRIALHLTRIALHLTRIALHLTRIALHLTRIALPLTRIALPLTRIALPLTRIALHLIPLSSLMIRRVPSASGHANAELADLEAYRCVPHAKATSEYFGKARSIAQPQHSIVEVVASHVAGACRVRWHSRPALQTGKVQRSSVTSARVLVVLS
jgi:hypothetical protein